MIRRWERARRDFGAAAHHGVSAPAVLVEATMRNLALIALGYRALVTLLAVAGVAGSATLDPAGVRVLVLVTAVLLAGHVAVLVAGRRGHLPPAGRWVVAADVAVALALNVWAAWIVAPGALFYDFGNPFSGYAVATVALWTGAGGRRLGLWLLAAGAVPLQFVAAAINGTAPGSVDGAKFLTRALWFVAAFALARLLLDALRRGADSLAAASERAGREERRRELLRDLHDGVLQALLGMIVRAGGTATDGKAIQDIRAEAQKWSTRIRRTLAAGDDHWNGILAKIGALVAEVEARGRIGARLTVDGSEPQLAPAAGRALAGATREAVNNAERHARATVVAITFRTEGSQVRVVVADDGVGFSEPDARTHGYGIPNSIRAALRDAGGRAEMTSSPGQGVRWDLTVPVVAPRATADLTERTILDLALVPVWYRALGLMIAAAGLVGSRSFGAIRLGPILAVMGALATLQLALVWWVRRRRFRPTTWWLPAADIGATTALMLWGAAAIPAGTVFMDYRDPFGLYGQATVALWGSVKRWATAVALVLFMAVPLPMVMAAFNDSALDWVKLASRGLWLVPALLLAKFVTSVARGGALLLAEENHRSGLATERAGVLKELHRSLLPGLDAIGHGGGGDGGPEAAKADIRRIARQDVARIRAVLRRADGASSPGWAALDTVVAQAEVDADIDVEVVCRGLEPSWERDEVRLVLAATGELLRRVGRHATLFAEAEGGDLRVIVRHDGGPLERWVPAGSEVTAEVSVTAAGGEEWRLAPAGAASRQTTSRPLASRHRVESSLAPPDAGGR